VKVLEQTAPLIRHTLVPMSSRVLNGQQDSPIDSLQNSPRSSIGDKPKHRRRPSGSLSSFSNLTRRRSSCLPPADLPETEAGVLQQLSVEERRQLADEGEIARYVKACNGSQEEVTPSRGAYIQRQTHWTDEMHQALLGRMPLCVRPCVRWYH